MGIRCPFKLFWKPLQGLFCWLFDRVKDTEYRKSWKKPKLVSQLMTYDAQTIFAVFTEEQLSTGLEELGASKTGSTADKLSRLIALCSGAVEVDVKPESDSEEEILAPASSKRRSVHPISALERDFWSKRKQDWRLVDIQDRLSRLTSDQVDAKKIILSKIVLIRALGWCSDSGVRKFLKTLQDRTSMQEPRLQRCIFESLLMHSSTDQCRELFCRYFGYTRVNFDNIRAVSDLYQQYIIARFCNTRLRSKWLKTFKKCLAEKEKWAVKIPIFRLAEALDDIEVWSMIAVRLNNPHVIYKRNWYRRHYHHVEYVVDKPRHDFKLRRRTWRKLRTMIQKEPSVGIQYLDAYISEYIKLPPSLRLKDHLIANLLTPSKVKRFNTWSLHRKRMGALPPNVLRYFTTDNKATFKTRSVSNPVRIDVSSRAGLKAIARKYVGCSDRDIQVLCIQMLLMIQHKDPSIVWDLLAKNIELMQVRPIEKLLLHNLEGLLHHELFEKLVQTYIHCGWFQQSENTDYPADTRLKSFDRLFTTLFEGLNRDEREFFCTKWMATFNQQSIQINRVYTRVPPRLEKVALSKADEAVNYSSETLMFFTPLARRRYHWQSAITVLSTEQKIFWDSVVTKRRSDNPLAESLLHAVPDKKIRLKWLLRADMGTNVSIISNFLLNVDWNEVT